MTGPDRRCSACLEVKPASLFGKSKRAADGFNCCCKPCDAARFQARKKGEKGPSCKVTLPVKIRALLAERNGGPVCTGDLIVLYGVRNGWASSSLIGMHRDGELFQWKRKHFNYYFSSDAAFRAYGEDKLIALVDAKTSAKATKAGATKRRTGRYGGPKVRDIKKPSAWEGAPVVTIKAVPKPAKGEAITPQNVKRTACPNWTHDPRYQCAPDEKPPALFSRLPLGATLYGMSV